jgi:hypothetical protein
LPHPVHIEREAGEPSTIDAHCTARNRTNEKESAMKTLYLLGLILGFAALAAAQDNCPYERVKTVEASWKLGPGVDCGGGISLQIGGTQVKSSPKSCPLFVIITPQHDEAQSSSTRTQVVPVGTVPQTIAFFDCKCDYFLFICVGSSCVFDRAMNIGQLQLLRTEPCPDVTTTGV